MQDVVNAALERGDYRAAADLLQTWKQESPTDPWLLLTIGRYQEATGHWESAEKTYLRLLRQVTVPKLMTQARQGIQRVQAQVVQAREAALASARAIPGSEEVALLCLEPVPREARQTAAQGLAKVMQMDAYTARLQLPGKGWRLYRLGTVGELQYFSQALTAAQAPAFWLRLADIKGLSVFRIQHFRAVSPQAQIVCQSGDGQLGVITFDWQEVTQGVAGQVPLFESVVDLDPWGKLQRRAKTKDYAEILDLHLHHRGCVLRLCDQTYQFRQGNPLPDSTPVPDQDTAIRPRWNALNTYIREQVTAPIRSGFTQFGESALDLMDLLPAIDPQLDLFRRQESTWDTAFHLFSSIHFLRATPCT